MKLAEALMERADLNAKISDLQMRIENNVLVQEGEDPSEDPKQLMKELNSSVDRLYHLMKSINLTNCQTIVDGRSLTDIIAEKDAVNVKLSAYKSISYQANQNTSRARGTEIKITSVLSVRDLRKQSDALSARIRELDNLLQSTNWQTDLIEQ